MRFFALHNARALVMSECVVPAVEEVRFVWRVSRRVKRVRTRHPLPPLPTTDHLAVRVYILLDLWTWGRGATWACIVVLSGARGAEGLARGRRCCQSGGRCFGLCHSQVKHVKHVALGWRFDDFDDFDFGLNRCGIRTYRTGRVG